MKTSFAVEPCKNPGARCLVVLACLLLISACSKPEPIKLGFVAGTSGRVADLGIAGRNATILAVEQRNAAGGVAGRPVELVVRNDEQDPEVARRVVQELIDAKVEGIVGHMTSSMSTATLPLANAAKVLMMSPTSTSKDFSGKDDYFFRVIADTASYSTKSALFHRNTLKESRIAIAYDVRNRSYSESWLNDFRTTFDQAGGKISLAQPFESGADVHFKALAGKLLDSQPDGIVLICNSVDAALLAQQIRQINSKINIGAAEWAGTEQLVELGGQAVEGMYLAQFVDRASTAPAYMTFRQDYLKRFSQEPGFAGVAAFDAANVVLDALARRKPEQSLKEAILSIGSFTGIQEAILIDANGDGKRTVFLTTIRNGQFVNLEK